MLLPQLTGEKVRLRPLKRADIVSLARNANHAEIAKYIPAIPYPYTTVEAHKWVNKVHLGARKDTIYQFGIEFDGGEGIIGMIGLNNVNRTDSNAEIEYWLGKKYWSRGYISEATNLILDFAFKTLRLRRVYAVTICINERSVRLLEKHGFMREGVWRQGSRMNRRWHDVYAYGILREEYLSKN